MTEAAEIESRDAIHVKATYDVVVVGAGPGGAAAAAAFASRGAQVLVLEAGGAEARLAGEWLHPPGVAALALLGLLPTELPSARGRGFVVYPDEGSDPIRLHYPNQAEAFACEHGLLVRAMRKRLAAMPNVTLLDGARVRAIDVRGDGVRFTYAGAPHRVLAGRIVGADGRGSIVRKAFDPSAAEASRGRMAGVLLEDVNLPFEGYGHVFVGGPGPALLYRIDDRHARLCLDVPRGDLRHAGELFAAFAPVLPAHVRDRTRASLERESPRWAAVRIRARRVFGHEGLALVGDATGSVHPLCAAGITLAVSDAAALARTDDVAEYAAARRAEGHVAELLSDALHTVLVGRDDVTTSIRHAMYDTWRRDPASRERTMAILSGQNVGGLDFGRAFTGVAIDAARALVRSAFAEGELRRGVRDVATLARFARYPASALLGPNAPIASRASAPPVVAERETRRRPAGGAPPELDAVAPLRLPPAPLRRGPDGVPVGPEFDYCVVALEQVSRSFAKPIALLPGTLRVSVTTGYLLCRIADTIEDAVGLDPLARELCFQHFLAAVEGRASVGTFVRAVAALPHGLAGAAHELALLGRLDVVLAVRDALPAHEAATVTRWVVEMTRGMAIYAHRPAHASGFTAPSTLSDLERYCYFVAGTVGHMLTDLFVASLRLAPAQELALRSHAESFGIGLQLVNILKDVADDAGRRASFVPESLVLGAGLRYDELLAPARRVSAHAAVAPLFELARKHLDRALEYVIAVPSEAVRVRLFCAIPLFMAARTLTLARGSSAMFEADVTVKMDRSEVEAIANECLAGASDDDFLRRRYASLWGGPAPMSPGAVALTTETNLLERAASSHLDAPRRNA